MSPTRWRMPRLKTLHLYLGLCLTLGLLFQAVTGTLLAFGPQIDEMLFPGLYSPKAAPGAPPGVDEIMARVWRTDPAPIQTVLFPGPDRPVWIVLQRQGDGRNARMTETFVDPGDGAILGRRDPRRSPLRMIHRWHEDWAMGAAGKALAAVAALGLTIMTASGLVLWWPGVRQLPKAARRALIPSMKGPPIRRWFMAHRALALWVWPVLAVVAVTGITLEYPASARALLQEPPQARIRTIPMDPAQVFAITGHAASVMAHAQDPDSAIDQLTPPGGLHPRWTIRLDHGDYGRLAVSIDASTGIMDIPAGAPGPAAVYLRDQRTLHASLWLGQAGRLLIGLAGLALAGLAATGTLFWLRRRNINTRTRSHSPPDAAIGSPAARRRLG